MSETTCKWCSQPMYELAAHKFCGNCDRLGLDLPSIEHYSGV